MLSLEAELRRDVEGDVRSDGPTVVVVARTKEDVAAVHAACRRHRTPIVVRGAGLSGTASAPAGTVALDLSRLDMVLEIDPARRFACVEAGTPCAAISEAVARFGLTFGALPFGRPSSTIGGAIGANACGLRSLVHGDAADSLEEAEVLLADGTRLRLGWTTLDAMRARAARLDRVGEIHRGLLALRSLHGDALRHRLPRVAHALAGSDLHALVPDRDGRLNLARLLAGSRGTLATILEAKVRLVEERPYRVLVLAGFEDVFAAADAVPLVLEHAPIGLEGLDARVASTLGEHAALLPEGAGWLFVELGAHDPEDVADNARELVLRLGRTPGVRSSRVVSEGGALTRLQRVRERMFAGESSAVDPARLGAYLRDLDALLASYGWSPPLGGHFGLGCVASTVERAFATPHAEERFRAYMKDATDLVRSYGGEVAGGHVDPARTFDDEIATALRRVKGVFDPDALLNPAWSLEPLPPVTGASGERVARAPKRSLLRAGLAFGAFFAALALALSPRLRRVLHVG